MKKGKINEVAAAAADINEVLKPDPLLDMGMKDEELKAEIVELLPNIKEGDALKPETWVFLKKLGWKDSKPEQKAEQKPTKLVGKKEEKKTEPKQTALASFSGNIQTSYKGKTLSASVENGIITFDKKKYNSPSLAGSAALIKAGRTGKVTCNGWTFWSYKGEDGSLTKIDMLRKA
uniref:RAMA domain-containing protein n=1 Tax=viral metagenome TaxID=1070528 RepID=A0A6M3ILV1_9ZZZZ